jgi:hypothetical protein
MAFADSMRLAWVTGLTDCTGARSWTTDRLFNRSTVTATSSTQDEFVLYVGNAKNSQQYFAHEADRFASAAFESVIVGTRNEKYPRSTGWLLIRAYYSAFFAVHALLRLHGWACTRLAPGNLKSVNEDLALMAPGSQIFTGGLYFVRSEANGRDLRCKSLSTSLGGTHEALWALLKVYLVDVVQVVLSHPDPTGQAFVATMDAFQALVDEHGGVGWFPTLRNRVNYSHEYGAWFPYVKSTCDYDRLQAIFGRWTMSPEDVLKALGNDELMRFVGACAFLVAACGHTVRDLQFRSKPSSPFRQSSALLL